MSLSGHGSLRGRYEPPHDGVGSAGLMMSAMARQPLSKAIATAITRAGHRTELGGEDVIRRQQRSQPIIALAGCLVLVEVSRFDAGGKQRIALQIGRLAAVDLGDAHVADQYGLLHKRANT